MTSKPTVIDLFAGGGGLSLGFSRAGFDVVYAVDSWSPAVETYRTNFDHPADLIELTTDTRLPRADVIVGGPPCQGFSSAGSRRSGDPRNSLVSVFAALIARHRPAAFVFENVEGFLTTGRGQRVFDLLDPLISIGYRIHLRKVNAANFGVPQHRKRVIAIGGLGWTPTFPAPTHIARGAPGSLRVTGHALPHAPSLSDALAGLPHPSPRPPGNPPDHYSKDLSEGDRDRAAALQPGMTMKDLPTEMWHASYRRRAYRRVQDGTPSERRGGAPAGLRRLRGEEPSKAITSGAISEFLHPTEDRPLTLRECARLQTLPDHFVFNGSASDRALLIANAVPPLLAEVIALDLFQDLGAAGDAAEGCLISFVPTASQGTSPALAQLIADVEARYGVLQPQLRLLQG